MSTLKRWIHTFLEWFGNVTGHLFRLVPVIARPLYRLLVGIARRLPDSYALHLAPFVTAYGRGAFNLGPGTLVTYRLPGGSALSLNLAEETQRQIYEQKTFEAGVTRFLAKVIRTGDICIDVGANVGYFSVLLSDAVGPHGRVIALEPEAGNFERLSEHARRNGLNQLVPLRIACGKEDGTGTLHINPLNHGGNSMLPFSAFRSRGKAITLEDATRRFGALTEEVDVRSLDSLIGEYAVERIAFLKIDIEGFEYEALQGASRLVSEGRATYILCEMNNDETRGEALDLLTAAGYRPYTLSYRGEPKALAHPEDRVGNVLFMRENR